MTIPTQLIYTLIVVRGLGELLKGSIRYSYQPVVIIMLCIHFSHSTVLCSFDLLLLHALVYSCLILYVNNVQYQVH